VSGLRERAAAGSATPTAVGRRPSFPWQAQFVLLGAIWGSSFLSMKVLDKHWAPTWVSLSRCGLGALTLLVVLAARRERLPSGWRVWGHLAVMGLLWNAIPFSLFAYAETHVSSVLAGLWNATTALTTLVAMLIAFPGQEKVTRNRLVGLAVGFAGVALVLGPWRSLGSGALIGQLACFAAATCYGIVFPYSRHFMSDRQESGMVIAAGQLLCASAWLALLVPFTRAPTLHIGLDGVACLLALGCIGTGAAFVLMYAIANVVGTATAATVAYVIPLFSTLFGVLLLGESLTFNEPIGATVVLLGIAISQDRLLRPRR
jgi:drug/metabolite transporter (DMT)-like permease